MATEPIVIEGNVDATHYANLYRQAHSNEENIRRRYARMLEGVEAIMAMIENHESSVYVLMSAVVAASRWDGEDR